MIKKLMFFTMFTACLSFLGKAQNTITVTINKIDKAEGNVEISLYNQAEAFPHTKGRYKAGNVTVKGNSVTYQFKNVHNGEYDVALYHDENANGIMDKNIFGIPKESYGFSNNVVPKMSAPSFKECMFSVKGSTNISIALIK